MLFDWVIVFLFASNSPTIVTLLSDLTHTSGHDCWTAYYLPAWLGHMLEVGEVILNPSVNVLQGHTFLLSAVDGKLDHGHVGIGGPF